MDADDYSWQCAYDSFAEQHLHCEGCARQRMCDFGFLIRRTQLMLLLTSDDGTDLPIMIRQFNQRWNDDWSQKHLEMAAHNAINAVSRSIVREARERAGMVCLATTMAGTPATAAASAVTWQTIHGEAFPTLPIGD